MSKNHQHHYRGIKEKVPGHAAIGLAEDIHEYHSRLEARCAKIFIKYNIRFRPHVKFECFDRNGKTFTYEVDFIFETPQKFKGISMIVNAIEVKGWLRDHDMLRIDALKFRHRVRTFIATSTLIDYWEKDGLLETGGAE